MDRMALLSMSVMLVFAGLSCVQSQAKPASTTKASQPATAPASRSADALLLRPGDVVLFFGNSITDKAKPEIDYLTADLAKQYPELTQGPGAVKFVKSGIGGEQAFEGAKRLAALLAEHKPTVVVVCYGTCEVTHRNEASFIPAMKDIIGQIRAAGAAIIIVSPPPPSLKAWRLPAPDTPERFIANLPRMAEQALKLAAEEKLPSVNAFAALTDYSKKTGKEFSVDGIHLSADGYRVMADALEACLGFGKPLNPQ